VPSYQLIVRVRCLQAAVVTTVTAQSDVSAEAKDVTATCPEGASVIGGGYVLDD
jgi:translation elongation factor EF-4